MLKTRAGKKKSRISCLNEVFTTIETSKEEFTKKLLKKIVDNYKLNVKLKTESDPGTKIKTLYKENQGEITRVNESETRSKVYKKKRR